MKQLFGRHFIQQALLSVGDRSKRTCLLLFKKRPLLFRRGLLLFATLVVAVSTNLSFIQPAQAQGASTIGGVDEAGCKAAGGIWTAISREGGVTSYACTTTTGTITNNKSAKEPLAQAKSLIYYRALRNCIDMGYWKDSFNIIANSSVEASGANTYKWFADTRPVWRDAENITRVDVSNRTRLGFLGQVDNEGWGNCNEGAWIKDAVENVWGFSSGASFLCAIGFTREVPVNNCADPSVGDSYHAPTVKVTAPIPGGTVSVGTPVVIALDKFKALYGDKIAPKIVSDQDMSQAAQYQLYLNSFKTFCGATGGSVWTIYEFPDDSAEPKQVSYTYRNGDTNGSTAVHMYNKNPDDTGTVRTCDQLANWLNELTDKAVVGYKQWKTDNPNSSDLGGVGEDQCAITGTCGNTTTCAIDGIGWIICPVVTFLAGIADGVYGIIENFLEVDVETLSTDTSKGGTYQAWQIMRNFANVTLIIIFRIIIFSQLSGLGVSNYGIKKTLPRLVVAAILINISFFLCQILVDISNILGASLKDFLATLPVFSQSSGNWAQDALSKGNFFTDIAANILIGQSIGLVAATAGVAAYFLGLGIFIPVIVAVIVAVIVTFFILLARQMLIVILVVMAPLAFAAMLLPNTEKWYKWWQKAFVGLLVVYPMIAVLFGGAQLAANVLIQGKTDLGWQLAAASIAILPLFFTPALLKGSLNAIPAVGGAARNAYGKLTGAGKKWSGVGTKKLGEYSAASNKRGFKRLSGVMQGGGTMGRLRQAAAQRAYEEPRMKDLMSQWSQSGVANDNAALSQIAAADPTSFKGQAALAMLATKGDAVTLAKLRKGFEAPGNEGKLTAYDKAIAPNYAALKAKHPGAVQSMGAKEWGGIKQADLHNMKDDAIYEGAGFKFNEGTGQYERVPGEGDVNFQSTLTTAMQDPEQEKHFTANMYKAMGVTPPSEAARQAAAAATPAEPVTKIQDVPDGAQQDNGLSIPRDGGDS